MIKLGFILSLVVAVNACVNTPHKQNDCRNYIDKIKLLRLRNKIY